MMPVIQRNPYDAIRPMESVVAASAAILLITTLALGFILASKGSIPGIISSVKGDALPLTALGGFSLIIFAVSLARYQMTMNKILVELEEIKRKADELSLSPIKTPSIDVTVLSPTEETPLKTPSATVISLYDEMESRALQTWLKDTLAKPKSLDEQHKDFQSWLSPLKVSELRFTEADLFDTQEFLRDESFQQELGSLRHVTTVMINKLATFIEVLIRADYQVDGGRFKGPLEELISPWRKAVVYLRDNVVLDLINILQGKGSISCQLLFSYYLGFQSFCFPLSKAETLACRRMVTADNFGNPKKAKAALKIRAQIQDFFRAFSKKNDKETPAQFVLPDPKAIKKIEECLVFLTTAFFSHPSIELQMEAKDFFKRLLTDNSDLFKDREVLEILDNFEPKKDHEFKLLAVLFVKCKQQKQLQGRFKHFFSIWVRHLIFDMKKKASEFFKILGTHVLPLFDQVIQSDDFESEQGKVFYGMKAALYVLTFNCGALNDEENLAVLEKLFDKEMELNFKRDAKKQVSLLVTKSDFVVKESVEPKQDKTTPPVQLTGTTKVAEAYHFPFLPMHSIAWWVDFITTTGVRSLLPRTIKKLLDIPWAVNILNPMIYAIYDGIIAKRPENVGMFNVMTNTSPFRAVFSKVTFKANKELKEIILNRVRFDHWLSKLVGTDERVLDLVHEYVHDKEGFNFLPVAQLMLSIGQHLSHVRKDFESVLKH